MRRKHLIGLAVVVVAVGGVLLAGAAARITGEKATGVVALRQVTMKANAAHMTAVKRIMTEYPQLLDHALFHAEAVEAAVAHLPDLFPPGSDQPATGALPAVWRDRTGFEAAAAGAVGLAKRLVEAARSGDVRATLAAYEAMGKNGCNGCHQKYREPDG